MGTVMEHTPGETTELIERLRGGDRRALAALFDRYRDRLRRMVELRIDARVRARLDASDVLQEAFIDVSHDLDAYLADPKLPPLLWLRLHVGRRLTTLHRQHLGTKMRDAGMEISLYRDALPEASSAALASMLLGKHTSPTQAALRAEKLLRVQEALNTLDPIDREVLALSAFRAAFSLRDGRSAGDQPGGRGETLFSCSETAQRCAIRHARRRRGTVKHDDVDIERIGRLRAV